MAALRRKYVFTWKIENFSLFCGLKYNEKLDNPQFKAENLGGSEWFLRLYPGNSTAGNFLSLILKRGQDGNNKSIAFCLELLDDNAKTLKTENCERKVIGKGYGFYRFFSISELKEVMEKWIEDTLTIRCHLIGDSVLMDDSVNESIAWTKIGIDRFNFKWSVNIPDSVSWERNRDIFLSEKSRLRMILTSPADTIEISIRNLDVNKSKCKLVFCKISLISLKGVEIKSKSAKYLFGESDVQDDDWNFPTFFSKNYLQSKACDLIQNNTYTLQFQISASTGEYLSEIKTNNYADSPPTNKFLDDSISALQEDLRNMLKIDKSPDVKLRVGNIIIPANKFILRARSPVFNAMFDQDMLENKTGIIEIQDLDAETVNFLLEFIYVGSVSELNNERAKKLIIAADKYQIPSLTKKCSLFLGSQLSVGNVCDVFALADMINLDNLKVAALKFIEKNSKRVILSDIWSNWMANNVKLANEILFKLTCGYLQ